MPVGFYEDHDSLTTKLLPFIFNDSSLRNSAKVAAHWHENIELLYCTKGAGHVIIMGEQFTMQKGDVIALNPNEIHMISTEDELDYKCFIISYDFCLDNGIDISKSSLINHIISPALGYLFEILYDDFTHTEDIDIPKIRLDVLRLIYELYKNYSRPTDTNIHKFDQITNVIKYIYEHYNEDITLDEAAAVAGLSKYYFMKKFKQTTGTTFVLFLNHIRCNNAAEMISDGVPVSEASYACGFHDPAFFSRTFKKLLGKSPSSLRKPAFKQNTI